MWAMAGAGALLVLGALALILRAEEVKVRCLVLGHDTQPDYLLTALMGESLRVCRRCHRHPGLR